MVLFDHEEEEENSRRIKNLDEELKGGFRIGFEDD